jgi:hypothetical protein
MKGAQRYNHATQILVPGTLLAILWVTSYCLLTKYARHSSPNQPHI